GGRDVDGQRLLVAVRALVVRRIARAVRILKEWRPPFAGVIALARLFNLENLGAQVPQDLRRPRPRQHAREVQHFEPREQTRRGGGLGVRHDATRKWSGSASALSFGPTRSCGA